MRILILHFLKKSDKNDRVLKNLESSAINNGHHVSSINGYQDSSEVRLATYDYISIVVGSGVILSANPPEKLNQILTNQGSIVGKKGCALVVQSGIGSSKTCRLLMNELEKQGMLLDYFDIIQNADHALHTGKKLG